ncbi:MAG TPA: TonB-dependent receptor plug domain-containing protein [Pseudidiomarina sp.]|nr:TonB-dependent receptor plug domain-containing protein [Pseudidiomarina sp.]
MSIMKFSTVSFALASVFAATQVQAQSELPNSLERITIIGEYRSTAIDETPTSVTALVHSEFAERGASHLEDVLNKLPNVNFSGGSSRARFIQIRGIGERSQFVDPINPSVGLLIDGINYSGLGQAAQLFDISQVEVYRGPQSGRFGADGLAGMIVLESTRASSDFSGVWHLGVGNYGERQGGLALGGDLGVLGTARFSVYQQRSDGFIENIYLDRDDTQSRSERMARLNVFSDLGSNWQLRTTVHALSQDNGYDAFSLDNTRQTLSDEPGEDDLNSFAVRTELSYSGFAHSEWILSYAFLDADSTYSYDEDWSYVGIAPGWEYSSFDSYQRDRQDQTVELRGLSKQPIAWLGVEHDWVLGLYRYQRDEQLQRDFFNFDLDRQDQFMSDYDNRHVAVYGELTSYIQPDWTLTTGLRSERYDNPYMDSNGVTEQPSDTMWGGRLSLSYHGQLGHLYYAALARGYKPGGVNGEALGKAQDPGLTELREFLQARSTFAPELLTSLELGHKWSSRDGVMAIRSALFMQDRDDVQLKGWINRDQSFVGYLQNAAGGKVSGVEVEWDYQSSETTNWFATLAWLNTEIDGFVTEDGIDMTGRDQAHAPNYQANIGLRYDFTETLSVVIQADAKDGYYYSDSHFSRADAVELLHARMDWHVAGWQLSVWARNLTNETYGIRGFFFGNDPRIEYAARTYEQFGEPRRFGFTASYAF